MKRYKAMLLGVCLAFAFLVVPSYATSTTPVYPSGTAYQRYISSAPASSTTRSTAQWFLAVSDSLYYGFTTMNKGLYNLQTNTTTTNTHLNTISTTLTGFKTSLWGGKSTFTHFASTGPTNYESSTGVLDAINKNVYYGLRFVITRLDTVNTNLTTLDGHLTTMDGHLTTMDGHLTKLNTDLNSDFTNLGTKLDSNFTSMKSNLDSNFSELFKALLGSEMSFDFQVDLSSLEGGLEELNGTVSGGFPMINRWFTVFYNLFFDPTDQELKDESSGQKEELKDNFFGDDSKGVQDGQIGSLGDISSSAGDLLDTGGNVGDVFTTIGDSSSSVWDWFSSGNSDAINGAGGIATLADEDDAESTPSLEIVDFYGAQRDELFSILGGGS